MVVAVSLVGEVQMTCNEVVDMISVGNRWVSAVRAMPMSGVMPAAAMSGCAGSGILIIDGESMLVDMVAMKMMQMPVVEIIGVAVMCDGWMATIGSVLMGVSIVNGVIAH